MSERRSRAHQRLARAMGRAIADYQMVGDGDRILCAVSGGKDSYTLLKLLLEAARRAPVHFEILAVHLDQGHPDVERGAVARALAVHGLECRTEHDDTYSIVRAKLTEGDTACSLCSRLRRAVLYRVATELGCNKIALGHHRDDIVETLMLNLLFVGQLKAMPPRLRSDDGAHVVIRPLAYCAEQDIVEFNAEQGFLPVPCGLCNTAHTQRQAMKELLADLERRHPGVRATMMAALRNVRPSQLCDVELWRALRLPVLPEEPDGR